MGTQTGSIIAVPVVIPLTQGQVTRVDSADLPLLSRYSWHVARCSGKLYAATCVALGKKKSRRIYMHRLIAGMDSEVVDHIDGDGLNNTRRNLRATTYRHNGINRLSPGSSVGLRGVYLQSGRYMVRIGRIYGGVFESKNEAAFKANQILESFMPGFGERNPVDFDELLAEVRGRRDSLNESIRLIEEATRADR